MSDYEEADNDVQMSGQTPASPYFNGAENLLNFDHKPKCLFEIPVEDQMYAERNEEEQQK